MSKEDNILLNFSQAKDPETTPKSSFGNVGSPRKSLRLSNHGIKLPSAKKKKILSSLSDDHSNTQNATSPLKDKKTSNEENCESAQGEEKASGEKEESRNKQEMRMGLTNEQANNLVENLVAEEHLNGNEQYEENRIKRKKDWKSWSASEKELFYEAIANGANYSSLQKLFKNMNDKIGTKSSQKIRDYYYRALKNVNKLLKSVGCDCVNRKNRDEVLLSLNCYGKMISSKLKDNSHADGLKNLKKHPRLFRKAALTLQKLITNKINSMRSKKKVSKFAKVKKDVKSSHSKKDFRLLSLNSLGVQKKIINLEEYRNLPYKKFLIRLFPSNSDTYYRMIEATYSPRIELQVAYTRSLSSIIEFLRDKWSRISKKFSNINLYLLPVSGLWVSTQGISFSIEDSKSFDIGDIFIGYGMPNTSIIYMQYSWSNKLDSLNTQILNALNSTNNHEPEKLNISCTDIGNSMFVNKASKSCSNLELINNNLDNAKAHESVISGQDSDDEKEGKDNKSILSLGLDYDAFDPLEFLNIYKNEKEVREEGEEKKNSSCSESEENNNDINEEEGRNEEEEHSYYGLDYYQRIREFKGCKEEKRDDPENSRFNNNSVNIQVLDFSNYSLNTSKQNTNLAAKLDEAKKEESLLKTVKKTSRLEEQKELQSTPTFNNQTATVSQDTAGNINTSLNSTSNPTLSNEKQKNPNVKRIPFIRMSPNSKKKNMDEISGSTFSALNPKKTLSQDLENKPEENRNIIRNLNSSSFSNKELEVKLFPTITTNKAESYISPTVKKFSEKEAHNLPATSSSLANKFNDKKIEDLPRFDFDEQTNNVNNLIMTNFPHEKNYSMFPDNENSILYKNHNSNLFINDIFNSNLSQINSYMRTNNHNLFNANSMKPMDRLIDQSRYAEEIKNEDTNHLGKKTKKVKKVAQPEEPKKKSKKDKEEENKKPSELSEKKKRKCKTPLSPKKPKPDEKRQNITHEQAQEKLLQQNINISNTSPYIINQNNYYSSFQRPISQQGYLPNPQHHPNFPPYYQPPPYVGIPDPHNLLDRDKSKQLQSEECYKYPSTPQQPMDYMMNYRYPPYMMYPPGGHMYPPYQYMNKSLPFGLKK